MSPHNPETIQEGAAAIILAFRSLILFVERLQRGQLPLNISCLVLAPMHPVALIDLPITPWHLLGESEAKQRALETAPVQKQPDPSLTDRRHPLEHSHASGPTETIEQTQKTTENRALSPCPPPTPGHGSLHSPRRAQQTACGMEDKV